MQEQPRTRPGSWKRRRRRTRQPRISEARNAVFEGYAKRLGRLPGPALVRGGLAHRNLSPETKARLMPRPHTFYAGVRRTGRRAALFYSDDHTGRRGSPGLLLPDPGVRAHKVIARQRFRAVNKVDAVVTPISESTMRNHRPRILLHAGLRERAGQARECRRGRLVVPDSWLSSCSSTAGRKRETQAGCRARPATPLLHVLAHTSRRPAWSRCVPL